MAEEIVNRVANSPLKSLDLDEVLIPLEVVEFDLANYLFQGLILKEKEFRTSLKDLDTAPYKGKTIALHCSSDAILPIWAYMLVSSKLAGIAKKIYTLDPESAKAKMRLDQVRSMDLSEYEGGKVVIKGCAEVPDKESLYTELTSRLVPVVQSLMYGEPCSTVPVFKKPRG